MRGCVAIAAVAVARRRRVRRRRHAAAASSSGEVKVPDVPKALTELGEGEGKLNLIAWAGYVEDGSTDPKVDWVAGSRRRPAARSTSKVGNTSDEMVTLMRTGQYDGVSASGNASVRLIAGGDVAPVNTDLIPNYADVFDGAQEPALQLGRRADVRRPARLRREPAHVAHGQGHAGADSWGAVFDENSPYKGKVTAYDDPIYIADAALYLKATQPDLKITNPYELDDKQFNAAVDLLKKQRGIIGEYWSDYTKEQAAFTQGDSASARRGRSSRTCSRPTR